MDYTYTNHLVKLIELLPDKMINYAAFSENPNIDLEYIRKNPDKPWSRMMLMANQNVTWSMIKDHIMGRKDLVFCSAPEWNIDWEMTKNKEYLPYTICANPNVTWDDIKGYFGWPAYHLFDMRQLWNILVNPNFTPRHFGEDWDYCCNASHYYARNPNFTWDLVQYFEATGNKIKIGKNHYEFLSENPNIDWDIIKNNRNKPWNHMYLSRNPNITMEIIENNPNIEWCYYIGLPENPSITASIIRNIVQKYPDKTWSYQELSRNPNMTWDMVYSSSDDNIGKPWDPYMLATNRFERHPVFMNRIRRQAIVESDILPRVLTEIISRFIGIGRHYEEPLI